MNEIDILMNVAEIGVALTGFASLAGLGFVCTIVAAGFAGPHGFHVYFGMLCLFLVISSTMFVLVIASLMTVETER